MKKRTRVQFSSDLPSMTQQHLKQECDVNSILERYRKTGMISHTRSSPGQTGDFSVYRDFRENLNIVKEAQHSFDSLPAHLRKKFNNDPASLLEFIHNDKNREEAENMGLVPKKAVKQEGAKNDDKTTITQPSTQTAT